MTIHNFIFLLGSTAYSLLAGLEGAISLSDGWIFWLVTGTLLVVGSLSLVWLANFQSSGNLIAFCLALVLLAAFNKIFGYISSGPDLAYGRLVLYEEWSFSLLSYLYLPIVLQFLVNLVCWFTLIVSFLVVLIHSFISTFLYELPVWLCLLGSSPYTSWLKVYFLINLLFSQYPLML